MHLDQNLFFKGIYYTQAHSQAAQPNENFAKAANQYCCRVAGGEVEKEKRFVSDSARSFAVTSTSSVY